MDHDGFRSEKGIKAHYGFQGDDLKG